MELIECLKRRGCTVATAESCTGGGIAKRITDSAGASSVFDGGIVSYANRIKHELLGVREETLARFGAVSQQTAEEMCRGVTETVQADLGISATGVAGPGGGTPEKPVGTVFVGLYFRPTDQVRILELHLDGDRDSVRKQVCEIALTEAAEFLKAQ